MSLKLLKVVIHQPDFMPWLGFFNKAKKGDVFICLDSVKMDVKNCGWLKRVKILVQGKPVWVTIPVTSKNKKTYNVISEILINRDDRLYLKAYRIIKDSYKKAPFFKEVFPLVEEYFEENNPKISVRNKKFIKKIFQIMKIYPEWYDSSKLEVFESKSTLNAELTLAVGGNVYISGEGAVGYLDAKDFSKRNIELVINKFYPYKFKYRQFNVEDFIPGLSIVDALMNCGFEGTRNLISGEE